MDLLYSRYSNPLEFMHLYMEQGRFGEFVENIIKLENNRKKEENEHENENKLWQLYLHSLPDKSYVDWKEEVLNNTSQQEQQKQTISKEQVVDIVNSSTDILDGFCLN